MLLLALLACQSDYHLIAEDPAGALAALDFAPAEPGESTADAVYATADGAIHKEIFSFGGDATTPVADYLFVIDDSISMQNVIGQFQRGFQSLTAAAFPERARVAVMSAMPGDYDDFSRPHRAVRRHKGIRYHPGFLGLIDGGGVATYRERGDATTDALLDGGGCDDWFAPDAETAAGEPCLLAHTRLALTAQRAEAGLTAFKQLLLKNAGQPIFRDGAAVNVIVVSDTHEPGFWPRSRTDPELHEAFGQLIAEQPDFDELAALVAADNLVASFRLHAIAPESECSEPWQHFGPSYFDVADAGDGVTADVCTVEDYAPIIQEIAQTGAVIQSPVFALKSDGAIQSVRVDGQPVGWSAAGGRGLVLDGGVPDARAEVEVVYRPQRRRALPDAPGLLPGAQQGPDQRLPGE